MRGTARRAQVAVAVLAAFLSAAASAADTQPPQLVSLTVLDSAPIDVARPPAAPTVRLKFTEDDSGLGEYFVGWVSPNGMQMRYRYDQSEAPRKSGTVDITMEPFSMYDQPGVWTIYNVHICDRANNCSIYDGAAIDPFTTKRTIRVVNQQNPDTGLPSATDAAVVTSSVSLAGNRKFRTRMTLDDGKSGVARVSVCFQAAVNPTTNVCTNAAYSYAAKGTEQFQEGEFAANAQAGPWNVVAVHVFDVPGNERLYSSQAELDALFPGGRVLTVGP